MRTFSAALLIAVGNAVSATFDYDHYYADFGHGYQPTGYDHQPEPVYYEQNDHHYPETQPTPVYYQDAYDGGNVPSSDFYGQVDLFNEWNDIWDQSKYEWRLQQEAELMVALEAMREALVQLDSDIDDLKDCISDNEKEIDVNHYGIHSNNEDISDNDDQIKYQQRRVEHLQDQCRDCQERLDTDRDVLVLHCQQFAFAKDMIGACADILTCVDTRLPYRADIFNGNPYGRQHEHKEYNDPEYHDHHRDHPHTYVEPSSKHPIEVGHYTYEDVHHEEQHADDHHYAA